MQSLFKNGAPGAIRTPDRLVRSQVLYPAELQALKKLRQDYAQHLTLRQHNKTRLERLYGGERGRFFSVSDNLNHSIIVLYIQYVRSLVRIFLSQSISTSIIQIHHLCWVS